MINVNIRLDCGFRNLKNFEAPRTPLTNSFNPLPRLGSDPQKYSLRVTTARRQETQSSLHSVQREWDLLFVLMARQTGFEVRSPGGASE